MEAVFRDCIEEERARGRTVLLSSHILSEVEALCDRVTHHPRRPRRRDRHARRAAAPDPHLDRRRAGRPAPTGLAALPGVHDLDVDGQPGPSARSTPPQLGRGAAAS